MAERLALGLKVGGRLKTELTAFVQEANAFIVEALGPGAEREAENTVLEDLIEDPKVEAAILKALATARSDIKGRVATRLEARADQEEADIRARSTSLRDRAEALRTYEKPVVEPDPAPVAEEARG